MLYAYLLAQTLAYQWLVVSGHLLSCVRWCRSRKCGVKINVDVVSYGCGADNPATGTENNKTPAHGRNFFRKVRREWAACPPRWLLLCEQVNSARGREVTEEENNSYFRLAYCGSGGFCRRRPLFAYCCICLRKFGVSIHTRRPRLVECFYFVFKAVCWFAEKSCVFVLASGISFMWQ